MALGKRVAVFRRSMEKVLMFAIKGLSVSSVPDAGLVTEHFRTLSDLELESTTGGVAAVALFVKAIIQPGNIDWDDCKIMP